MFFEILIIFKFVLDVFGNFVIKNIFYSSVINSKPQDSRKQPFFSTVAFAGLRIRIVKFEGNFFRNFAVNIFLPEVPISRHLPCGNSTGLSLSAI